MRRCVILNIRSLTSGTHGFSQQRRTMDATEFQPYDDTWPPAFQGLQRLCPQFCPLKFPWHHLCIKSIRRLQCPNWIATKVNNICISKLFKPLQLSTFGWTHVREIVQRYTELCWWKFYGELLMWNKYIPWCDEMRCLPWYDEMWCLPWCDESPGDAGHRLHQLLLNPHRYWPTEPLIKLTLLQMSPFHFHWACLIFFNLTSVITLVLPAHFIVFIRSRERSLSVWSNHRCVGGAAAPREHHIQHCRRCLF